MRLAFAIFLILGAAGAFGWFLFDCAAFNAAEGGARVCRFVYDYQTLLAGVIALAAAFFALWPVFDQVHLSRLQSMVMTREVLVKRLAGTDKRWASCSRLLRTVTYDFDMEIYGGDFEAEPSVSPEWAHNAEQVVGGVVTKLEIYQRNLSDPGEVNDARAIAVRAANELQSCLNLIPLPYRAPWDDPELNWTEAQISEAKEKAERDAERAERELPEKIAALQEAGGALDRAYATTASRLRTRLRKIDDLVLEMRA